MSDNKLNATHVEDENTDNVVNPGATLQLERTAEQGHHYDFFPIILYDIICSDSNSDIITWLPSGKAFLITDKKKFARDIIPRHFPQMVKFTSFTRKLARWGFQRVPRGPYIGSYYHPSFIKGFRHKCFEINYSRRSNAEMSDSSDRNHFRMVSTLGSNLPIHPSAVGNNHLSSTRMHANSSQIMGTFHPMSQFPLHTVQFQTNVPTQFPSSYLTNALRQGSVSNNRHMPPINAAASFSVHSVPQSTQIRPLLWNHLGNAPTESQMVSDPTWNNYLRMQLQREEQQQHQQQQQEQQQLRLLLLQRQLFLSNQVQDLNLLPRQQEHQNTPDDKKTSEGD